MFQTRLSIVKLEHRGGAPRGMEPAETPALSETTVTRERHTALVGKSERMLEILDVIHRVSRSDAPVLISGETGTGKEVVAEAIHAASARADRPLVVCDLSAVGPTLLESELFGHRRGAFTSADRERQGAFVRAHGGTIFLDEVGELPKSSQPRLLRAIERREIKPVGDDDFRTVDVRIIAATNRNLAAETREGRFRSDLYHRLAVVRVELPPLRERREDIPLLATRLLEGLSAERNRPVPDLSNGAMSALVAYDWPGNVRELKNVLRRALSLDPDASRIEPDYLGIEPPQKSFTGDSPGSWETFRQSKGLLVEKWEREYIQDTVRLARGNMTTAARLAGITRAHLYRLMRKHRLKRFG